MKIREVLLLRQDGWVEITQRGRHRQLTHPIKRARVTVAGKLGDDLAPGALCSLS
jgi:predicted RNA binding protein YcfA (HicA-like mRNA interferase family)